MGDREHFSRRTGLERMPKLVGMNKSRDPASLEDNEFADLINVRLQGGRIRSRGGQEKVHDSALPGCVEGIFPVDEGPFVCDGKMWFNSRDNLFTVTPGDPMVNQDPPFHPSIIIGHHDGAIWLKSPGTFGGFGAGFRVSTITDDETTHTVLFDPTTIATTIGGIAGETHKIASGDILVPCRTGPIGSGAGVVFVVRWSGAASIDFADSGNADYIGAIPLNTNALGPFFTLAGVTYLFKGGSSGIPQQALRRDGAGAWTPMTTPAVSFTAIGVYGALLYGGGVYNAGTGGYDISTWDGAATTFALVHTIPVATGAGGQVVRIFSFNGKLYYLYAIPIIGGGLTFILGCFDGTTWDDVIFTFTPTLSIGENLNTAWVCASSGCVRGPVRVGATPPPSVIAYCAASQGKNLAWFFKQTLYPNPQTLYLYTDSAQRSRLQYFVD